MASSTKSASATKHSVPKNLEGTLDCKQGAIRAVRYNVDGNYCLTGELGPVHMVKKGHKYVTFLQINVHRVMILSQKLGKFIWRWDIYLIKRVIYLTRRDIYFEKGHNFVKKNRGRNFDHVYEPLMKLILVKSKLPPTPKDFYNFRASKGSEVHEVRQIRRL